MLEEFLSLLCGRFNNAAQAAEQQALDPNFPLAAHCNTACNDKIAHLPAGFAGVFVVEESTYTANGKTHASPHLFLFTEEGDGIRLTSYEIPAGYDKDTFTYAAMGRVEYADLVPSKKFTPALYRRDGNAAAQAGSPRCSSSHCGSGSPPTGSKSARQWSLTANGPSGLTSRCCTVGSTDPTKKTAEKTQAAGRKARRFFVPPKKGCPRLFAVTGGGGWGIVLV